MTDQAPRIGPADSLSGLLDLFVEYLSLRAADRELATADRARLALYEQSIPGKWGSPPEPENVADDRADDGCPAALVDNTSSARSSVRMMAISAGGVRLRGAVLPPPGTEVTLYVAGGRGRVAFPLRVCWARGSNIGLVFRGRPWVTVRGAERTGRPS